MHIAVIVWIKIHRHCRERAGAVAQSPVIVPFDIESLQNSGCSIVFDATRYSKFQLGRHEAAHNSSRQRIKWTVGVFEGWGVRPLTIDVVVWVIPFE